MANTGVRKFRGRDERIVDLLEKDERRTIEDMKVFSSESSVNLLGGLGGAGQGGNLPVSGQGIYLPIAGGQMKGPIAYNPVLVEIKDGILDIRKTVGAFTGRIIVNGEGGDIADEIDQILSDKVPGQQLSMQGTVGELTVLKHLALGGGKEDLRIPGEEDFILPGENNVTMIYDAINNEWTFMDSAIVAFQRGVIITPVKEVLNPGPTIDIELDIFQHYVIHLSQNLVLTFKKSPANLNRAEQFVLEFVQDSGGGNNLTFSDLIHPSAPNVEPTGNSRTVMTGFVRRDFGSNLSFDVYLVGS